MAYSEQKKAEIFMSIITKMTEGQSVRKAIEESPISMPTFFAWIKDPERLKQYVCAREIQAEYWFDKLIEVIYHRDDDHTPFTGSNVIQRDRLIADSLKWILARMNPKKYGDALKLSGDAENPIEQKIQVEVISSRTLKTEESEE